MNYIYKNKTILEYLKGIGIKSDRERMNITREIILLSMKNDITFEEAVDLYLQNFENKQKENKKIKKSSKEDKGIFYKGIKLKEYLKKYYSDDLQNSSDIDNCYRSIKNFIDNNSEIKDVSNIIDIYFNKHYQIYLNTHNFNKLKYKGINLNEIIAKIIKSSNKDKVNYLKKEIYKRYIILKATYNDEDALYYSLLHYFSKKQIDEINFNRKTK